MMPSVVTSNPIVIAPNSAINHLSLSGDRFGLTATAMANNSTQTMPRESFLNRGPSANQTETAEAPKKISAKR